MTWSGGGAPHSVWSSVVWASLTRVASYPLTNAPCSVERTHASVCAPTTTSLPTPRPASTVSRVVSSKESPYFFSTSGSASPGVSSGTIRQLSLPLASCSSECWTQTTGTRSRRAFSTRLPTFATTLSRACAPSTTPFCTSMTRRAVFGRFSSVLMVSSFFDDRLQTFEDWAPVVLSHLVGLFLARVVVLLECQEGLAVLLGEDVRDGVVVLGLVFTAAHRTPVGILQQLLRLDFQNFPLVLIGLALPLARPGNGAAHLPIGLHVGSVQVLFDQLGLGEPVPDRVDRSIDRDALLGYE